MDNPAASLARKPRRMVSWSSSYTPAQLAPSQRLYTGFWGTLPLLPLIRPVSGASLADDAAAARQLRRERQRIRAALLRVKTGELQMEDLIEELEEMCGAEAAAAAHATVPAGGLHSDRAASPPEPAVGGQFSWPRSATVARARPDGAAGLAPLEMPATSAPGRLSPSGLTRPPVAAAVHGRLSPPPAARTLSPNTMGEAHTQTGPSPQLSRQSSVAALRRLSSNRETIHEGVAALPQYDKRATSPTGSSRPSPGVSRDSSFVGGSQSTASQDLRGPYGFGSSYGSRRGSTSSVPGRAGRLPRTASDGGSDAPPRGGRRGSISSDDTLVMSDAVRQIVKLRKTSSNAHQTVSADVLAALSNALEGARLDDKAINRIGDELATSLPVDIAHNLAHNLANPAATSSLAWLQGTLLQATVAQRPTDSGAPDGPPRLSRHLSFAQKAGAGGTSRRSSVGASSASLVSAAERASSDHHTPHLGPSPLSSTCELTQMLGTTPPQQPDSPDSSGSLTSDLEWAPPEAAVLLGRAAVREALACLAVGSWDFDASALSDAADGRPLAVLGLAVLQLEGIFDMLPITPAQAWTFLGAVEAAYVANPYHCNEHAADVLCSTAILLEHCGVKEAGIDDPLDILAALLAAILHDVGHPGLNNDYLIKTEHDLAVTYNDKSPLENFHVAKGWRLLTSAECGALLCGLPKADRVRLRATLVSLVLSTDLKSHFDSLSAFQQHFGSSSPQPGLSEVGEDNEEPERDDGPELRLTTPTERLLMLQMCLKCADLGHLARPLPVHLRWVQRLQSECWLQGDQEMAAGLNVMPMNDRSHTLSPKSQLGFFEVIVLPMSRSMLAILPSTAPYAAAIENNYDHWMREEVLFLFNSLG